MLTEDGVGVGIHIVIMVVVGKAASSALFGRFEGG